METFADALRRERAGSDAGGESLDPLSILAAEVTELSTPINPVSKTDLVERRVAKLKEAPLSRESVGRVVQIVHELRINSQQERPIVPTGTRKIA